MAVTRSKRAANNKWDKENMKIVACKIRKEQAEQFKQYAEDRGTTSNALLKNYVLECRRNRQIERHQASLTRSGKG